MKKIILQTKTRFSFLLNSQIILSRKIFYSNHFKNYIELNDDYFTAKDHRLADHLGACYEEKIKNKIIKEKVKFLEHFGGKKYETFFVNKEIENNIRKIFRIIIYTKKVYLEKRLEGSVYIWPVGISMKIFNEMKTLNLVPKYIKIYYLANFINII